MTTATSSNNAQVLAFTEKLRAAELEKAGLEEEVQGLRDQVAQKKAEADKELKRKERLEKEMRDMRAVLEARHADIRDKQAAVQQSEEHVAKLQVGKVEPGRCAQGGRGDVAAGPEGGFGRQMLGHAVAALLEVQLFSVDCLDGLCK